MAERVNARLKDEFGARFLRVRGALKVKCHLMFGIVALAVDQIIPCRRLQDRPCLTQLAAQARRRKIHLAQGIMQEAHIYIYIRKIPVRVD